MIFLIKYMREDGQVVFCQEYDDSEMEKAQAARLEMEIEQSQEGRLNEIVLLQAENLDALKKTHSRYFKSLREMLEQKPVLNH
jgi:hypothetical protein